MDPPGLTPLSIPLLAVLQDAEVQEVPEAKRQATGKPSAPCTHEVLFPKDYDRTAAEKELDPDVYGASGG